MDTDSFSREVSNKRSRPVILLMMNNFLTNYNKSKGFTAHVDGFTTFKNLSARWAAIASIQITTKYLSFDLKIIRINILHFLITNKKHQTLITKLVCVWVACRQFHSDEYISL
jgi:hypothetical protein